MGRLLPGGLLLRTAEPADVDGIGRLLVERGEPADAVDHRLILEDPDAGLACSAVVVDGDRVVSTATLLDETMVLDGLSIPAGQVELVATDRDFEGRGLVRALMAWAHEQSARRGHLVQLVIGIPYFYRQFGYQYSVPVPCARTVAHPATPVDGHTVRRAGTEDIPAMTRLQDATQRGYNLHMPHSPACWRWLVSRTGSSQVVVEHAGEVVGTARITAGDEDVVLGEVAAAGAKAVRALLAHVASHAGRSAVTVKERPGSLAGDALESHLAPQSHSDHHYLRVPDVAALVRHLAPVLSARLARSGRAEEPGEAVVSFFRYHLRLAFHDGILDDVRLGGPMQAPGSVGGAGVAPDLVGPLLFGPLGIAGLSRLHPDVYPGPDEALMHALFPPLTTDLLTLYLP